MPAENQRVFVRQISPSKTIPVLVRSESPKKQAFKPHIYLHRYSGGRAYWRVLTPLGYRYKGCDRATKDRLMLAYRFIHNEAEKIYL